MSLIQVDAYQITNIDWWAVCSDTWESPGATLRDGNGNRITALAAWMAQWKPKVGDWWVVYPNGQAICRTTEQLSKTTRRISQYTYITPWLLLGCPT